MKGAKSGFPLCTRQRTAADEGQSIIIDIRLIFLSADGYVSSKDFEKGQDFKGDRFNCNEFTFDKPVPRAHSIKINSVLKAFSKSQRKQLIKDILSNATTVAQLVLQILYLLTA